MKNSIRAGTGQKRPTTSGHFCRRFYSKKNNCLLWLGSHLEKCFALHLEFDPQVLSYASQPETIIFEGRKRYTVDFLVAMVNSRPFFVEVHHENLIKEEFLKRFNAAKDFLALHDEPELKLITNKDINLVKCDNLDSLYPYKDQPLPSDICIFNTGSRHLKLDELINEIQLNTPYKTAVSARRIALTMIANGKFKADLTLPLSGASVLEQVCDD
ncbi:hypothetical protein [Alishewanella sp. HL-SH05]|uniref:hypothetical protein n=1 Tax=Alishewanella sp. HL-SH05 TaxID=3461145 RepID=UPI0040415EAE